MYCLADAVTQGSLKGTETGNGGTKYVETSPNSDLLDLYIYTHIITFARKTYCIRTLRKISGFV